MFFMSPSRMLLLTSDHVFVFKVQREISRDLQYKRPMIMSSTDVSSFQSAIDCWVCQKPLDDDRVRDHDHITGKTV